MVGKENQNLPRKDCLDVIYTHENKKKLFSQNK